MIDALAIARLIHDEWICRYGSPRVLLSDRGKQFISDIMEELCTLWRIDRIFTSAFHPQTDGLVERFNCVGAQWNNGIPCVPRNSVLFFYSVTPWNGKENSAIPGVDGLGSASLRAVK